MVLAIDIGNTNIVIGCFEGERILFVERVSTNHSATDLEYASTIRMAMHIHGMDADAMNYWYCVEGAAELAEQITGKPVVGSIYVEQYEGDVRRFERAVTQAIVSSGGGMMLFDMCHICSRDWWNNLERAIGKAQTK